VFRLRGQVADPELRQECEGLRRIGNPGSPFKLG